MLHILFIGGTGIISSACSQLAVNRGMKVYNLTRGISSSIRTINGVTNIQADIRNSEETKKALKNMSFDVVVDFISFVPEHIEDNVALFKDITKQYIFISSASIYQTPPQTLPVTENTPLENPYWEYSRNKIACEDILFDLHAAEKFPVTIVRPSHTYDKTLLPLEGGYTVLHRILNDQPVVIHGDGTSIWTLTHHTDFAKGLVGLFGKEEALGEAYHITSDEWLTWNGIYEIVGAAFNKTPKIVHIPSDIIAQYHKDMGDGLLGDKTHSMIFDNSKIKSIVPDFVCTTPFEKGAQELAQWYTQHPDFGQFDSEINTVFDTLIQKYSDIH
ncbi:MAG: NAD-dependent epimerase/dehydratase family protein [Bacteroidales bacterium]|jgi:nucleoside-diphosphate-sugar epimerase|nr:NAD-dependent epimerase/dehydratase family protein [Bacteroidales bacterium]